MMGAALWWMYGVLLCSVIQHTSGLRVAGCSGDHGAVELKEKVAEGEAVCEDIAQNQQIEILMSTTLVASCVKPSHQCYNVNPFVLKATRGVSTVTATFPHAPEKHAAKVNDYSVFDLICRPIAEHGVSCPIDVVYAPKANEISCDVSASLTGTVTVSCTISKAYSARNRYICDIREGDISGLSVGRAHYSYGSSSGYVSGDCSCSFKPRSNGIYSYMVVVYPGVTAVSAGSVNVSVSGSDLYSLGCVRPVVDSISGPPPVPTRVSGGPLNRQHARSSGSVVMTSVLLMTVTMVASLIL